ncbi:DDE transposase family protein [Parabacteroides goldsteinii]|uniref:DDE transposase family protein n=1 Tax=Parabacteroides goldsteinii TaxID=328812 RepID=UPI001F5DF1F5|nr:DDE transposase family protein [Parabacteroides goldsteinii]
MYYGKIRHRYSQELAATGLTPAEFDALLITFKYHWEEYYSHFTLEGKVRQRISYNRKTSVLPLIQDKMFFRYTNPLQELHAIQFEMTQPQANKWIHLLSEILQRTLKTLGELPDRNSKRLIHILKGCEDVLLDGTERPIQRPVDEDRQSACYSGKKNS